MAIFHGLKVKSNKSQNKIQREECKIECSHILRVCRNIGTSTCTRGGRMSVVKDEKGILPNN